jgi:RNA recognition motif-containing protein
MGRDNRQRERSRDRDIDSRKDYRDDRRDQQLKPITLTTLVQSSSIDFSRKDTSHLPQRPNQFATPIHDAKSLKSADTIYISNLPKTVTEESLCEYFGTVGTIKLDKKRLGRNPPKPKVLMVN